MTLLLLATTVHPARPTTFAFEQPYTLGQLDELLQDAQLKLTTSLEKVIAEAERENLAITDLRGVLEEADRTRKSCAVLQEEAQSDSEAFRQEMQLLRDIVRGAGSPGADGGESDQREDDWSALSLLGERSMTDLRYHRQQASGTGRGASQTQAAAGVKKAAELHFSLVKAAQAADARCRRHEREEDVAHLQSKRYCIAAQDRLKDAYEVASAHLRDLLANSEHRAADDACFRGALALLEDRRRGPDQRISVAQRELCSGYLAGDEAEGLIRKVQEAFASISQGFASTACAADEDWGRYVAAVGSLAQLSQSRHSFTSIYTEARLRGCVM